MSWLDSILPRKKPDISGVWVKCDSCGAILLQERLSENLNVCHKCNYHFKYTPDDYIKLLFDNGSISEINSNVHDTDFLKFQDTKKYSHRIKDARHKTGHDSAIVTGIGKMEGRSVAVGIMDFRFIGGSLSSSVGEKIVRLIDEAIEKHLPVVIITQSGGARMQESTTALMQMGKTSAAVGMLSRAKLPYIVVLTNPTTGGVTASYGMLGDIHLAEPKALIGFAGPRVIKETMKCDLPEGFQKSEFLLEHGYCDRIVRRHEMKEELVKIISLLMD